MDISKDRDFTGQVLVITLDTRKDMGPMYQALKNVSFSEIGGRVFVEGERAMDHGMGLVGHRILLAWDKVLRVSTFVSIEQFMAHKSMREAMKKPFPGLF
ncbi:MAG: hypothetical protein P1V97_25295 [Planctomycetota bacterium]|nr:hypothetical protein [Planctomycetota bacterium]